MLPQEDGACTSERKERGRTRLGWKRHSIEADSILRTSEAEIQGSLPFFLHLARLLSRLSAWTRLRIYRLSRPQLGNANEYEWNRGKPLCL